MITHTERLTAAASRLKAFFDELSETFVERDDALQQIALALLSREHVLLTGPPGTAKSRLAWSVLGRIPDETSGTLLAVPGSDGRGACEGTAPIGARVISYEVCREGHAVAATRTEPCRR